MFEPSTVLAVILLYMGALFVVALWVEKRAAAGVDLGNHPLIYSLSLAVYCTTWTYYGSVGNAVKSGTLFYTIYLGPTLALTLWWLVVRRMVRIRNTYGITSIADFISVRYGKSQAVAAMVTAIAFIGLIPYMALQLKAVITTFSLIVVAPASAQEASWASMNVGLVVTVLMTVFTIAFGVRRLDSTERHQGMVVALAVECVAKLLALVAVGVFVVYFAFDGFGDIFRRVAASSLGQPIGVGVRGPSYQLWTTCLVLSMAAFTFLPRQFHMAVVENFDERHIRTAMWVFPLYAFLVTLFVLPIAWGGLLLGYPPQDADTFVLSIPMRLGQRLLSLVVFVGGVSAATGMIMASSVALSTMISNHVILPIVVHVRMLHPLRRHLLQCRWGAVAALLATGYWFEEVVGRFVMLVDLGFLSFAAVLQFAPAIIGGMFWRQGNKTGAILGLGAGFLTWVHTLVIPALVTGGWVATSIVEQGPWGLALLRPQHLFGVTGMDPLSHAVFWSLVFNTGLYVCGSLLAGQTEEERSLSEEFAYALAPAPAVAPPKPSEAFVVVADKRRDLVRLVSQYLAEDRAQEVVHQCLVDLDLAHRERMTVMDLTEVLKGVKKHLAGSIGAAASHLALQRGITFTPREKEELSRAYGELLAEFRLAPSDLRSRVDYYQEREALLTRQAMELAEKVRERDGEIDERRRVEQALRDSEERFRATFEMAAVGMVQSDAVSGRFLHVNARFCDITGYAPDELAGRTWCDLTHPDDLEAQQRLQELLLAGEIREFSVEKRYVRKDGRVVWAQVTKAVLLRQEGRPCITISAVKDITQRREAEEKTRQLNAELEKRVRERTAELEAANSGLLDANARLQQARLELETSLEETLRAKEAADSASRAKSDFLAAMSHEIRTPINGVMGMLFLLAESSLPQAQREMTTTALESAEALLAILNDILDFSRIEADKMAFEEVPFDLREVVLDVSRLLAPAARKKGLDLDVSYDEEAPRYLVGDPGRIRQVLVNLVGNAVKFTPRGSVLVHVLPGERGGELPEPGMAAVRVEVEDTGIGIPEDKVDMVFDRFTQADPGVSRRFGGTGLGLAICRGLVHRMGGSIGVRSQFGRGSTFWVRLALPTASRGDGVRVATAAPPPSSAPPSSEIALRVLVAEDNVVNQMLAVAILEGLGCRVDVASDGREALDMFASTRYDLVFMDCQMPEVDGFEATRLIRLAEGGKVRTPVIAMTAQAMQGDRERCLQAGMDDYLAKPLHVPSLRETVRQWGARSPWRQPSPTTAAMEATPPE